MSRKDFLRHIVNTILSEYSRRRKDLIGVLDEVRKLIASAEDKYNFSIYGGDPSNLAKYIESSDFDLVVNVLKSAKALDVLEQILEKTIESYSDYPELIEVLEKKLNELRKGITSASELKVITENIEKKLGDAKIEVQENKIIVKMDHVESVILLEENKYVVLVKADVRREFDNHVDAVTFLEKIYRALR